MPVDARQQPGLEQHLDATLTEPIDGVAAEGGADLGQDAAGGLDEHPTHRVRVDLVVVAACHAGHVLEFGERLDAGVTAADHDKGQRADAAVVVARGAGRVDALEDVVAQRDGLLDLLEAEPDVGQARDWHRAGHGTEPDHDGVVAEVERGALCRVDVDDSPLMVDRTDSTGDQSAAAKNASEGTTTWRGSMLPAAASGRNGW